MKIKPFAIIITCLVVVTVVLAAAHLSTRDKVPDGALKITFGTKNMLVDMDMLDTVEIEGEIVNGKGEKIPVYEQGVLIRDVLDICGFAIDEGCSLKITASDEFYAVLSFEEIMKDDIAYLAGDDECLRLIVFGDSDSKRNVKNVVKMDIVQS